MTAQPTCPHCLKAAQVWHYGGLQSGCVQCGIREIATSPKHIRDAVYDGILKQQGHEAVAGIRECVRLEFARIVALKGRTP